MVLSGIGSPRPLVQAAARGPADAGAGCITLPSSTACFSLELRDSSCSTVSTADVWQTMHRLLGRLYESVL